MYKVIYTETLVHEFYVEAISKDAAEEEFQKKLSVGEFDFSDGCLTDADYTIKEEEE